MKPSWVYLASTKNSESWWWDKLIPDIRGHHHLTCPNVKLFTSPQASLFIVKMEHGSTNIIQDSCWLRLNKSQMDHPEDHEFDDSKKEGSRLFMTHLKCWGVKFFDTDSLPETNSSPLKIGLPNRKVEFQPSIFRCETVAWHLHFHRSTGPVLVGHVG